MIRTSPASKSPSSLGKSRRLTVTPGLAAMIKAGGNAFKTVLPGQSDCRNDAAGSDAVMTKKSYDRYDALSKD